MSNALLAGWPSRSSGSGATSSGPRGPPASSTSSSTRRSSRAGPRPTQRPSACWRSWGIPPDGDEAILWQVTERLARDPESRSSIAGALNAARENTRAVRHVIPVELWEKINATWSDLPHQWELARRVGPASYLAFVKTQTAAITGLADTTMSRDQTWLFFTLGRCLERTDVVARQLASLSFDDIPDSGLVMLLRACGGYEPYLRLAQGVVDPGRVLDFLLRDRLFPRSAFASLTVAEECLAQISPDRADEWDEARGLIGLARAELEYSPPVVPGHRAARGGSTGCSGPSPRCPTR